MDDQTVLYNAIVALRDDDDAHWTKDGLPNLNVLIEEIGGRVTRKDQQAVYDRHRAIANDDAESAGQDVVYDGTVPTTQADEADQDHDQRPGHGGQFISLGGGKRRPAPAT